MYGNLRASIDNTAERLAWIESEMTSVKSASAGTTPVQGGGNKYEDRILDLIVQKQRLQLTRSANEIRLGLIDKGLAALTDTERQIVITFAENRSGVAVEILRDRTGYEQAQIYRIYNEALYRYTIAEYGIPEF
jgi:hypothetical protein